MKLCKTKTLLRATLLAALSAAAGVAAAHTVWLEPKAGHANQYDVLFGGHEGKLETFNPEKLQTITVYDSLGNTLEFSRKNGETSSVLTLPDNAALVAIYFDNGIWTQNAMGEYVNKPMSEVPGATRATLAVKYHKTVLRWSDQLTQPLGQTFEVLPLAGTQPVAGEPFAVKVLVNGKPVQGIQLGRGEIGTEGTTNAEGVASFIPEPGFNKLWAGQRSQVNGEDYTELSYEYLFGFTAKAP